MPYTPTTWVNDDLPAIDAVNLNKIEGAINSLYDAIEIADPFPQYPLATDVATDFANHISSGDHDTRYLRKNTSSPVLVTLGASPNQNINNTASIQVWYFYGGTISDIGLLEPDGVTFKTVQTSTNCTVIVPPGYNILVTYSSAPTAIRHNL